ncbi:MAG: NUDIX domain-containing protein [Candidatus Woesearchaeota archaeon]
MNNEKFEKEILVVPRDVLFREKYFQGFMNVEEYNYIPIILKNSIWVKRKEAEFNPKYQQIIPYGVIINPKTKRVFVYKRSSEGKYSEKRLYNKISLGVGGHIEKEDLKNKNSKKNIIESCLIREIKEELNVKNIKKSVLLGFLKLEDNSIDKDHFGVVYLIHLNNSKISVNKDEIALGKFISFEELYKLRRFAEGWTSALINPLIEHYKNNKNRKKINKK